MFFGVGCNFARRRPIATLQSGLVGSAASGSGKRSLLFAPWGRGWRASASVSRTSG